MASNYPPVVDSFVDPTPGVTKLNDPVVNHPLDHSKIHDAIKKIQTKLGIGAAVAAVDQVLLATGAGITAFGQITNAYIAAAAGIAVSKLAAGGTAGRVVGTTDGANMSMVKTYDTPTVASASGNLTLTTTNTTIPGCSIPLGVGKWFVVSMVDMNIAAGDVGNVIFAVVVVGTATASLAGNSMIWVPAAAVRDTKHTMHYVSVTVAGTVLLQASKSGGAGTSAANAGSIIEAFYVGP